MYLLIRMRPWFLKEERLNLHPTMYLLILPFPVSEYSMMILFTSHYVSINSGFCDGIQGRLQQFTSHYVSINSSAAFSAASSFL